jgi:hypothetical protein
MRPKQVRFAAPASHDLRDIAAVEAAPSAPRVTPSAVCRRTISSIAGADLALHTQRRPGTQAEAHAQLIRLLITTQDRVTPKYAWRGPCGGKSSKSGHQSRPQQPLWSGATNDLEDAGDDVDAAAWAGHLSVPAQGDGGWRSGEVWSRGTWVEQQSCL